MPNDPIIASSVTDVAAIDGLKELWNETLGDPRIFVAILDGPVDKSHPSLAAANLTQIETLVSGVADEGPASRHGTHIASVIFGSHDGPIKGIAPLSRGLILPVFKDGINNSIAPCSQLDLARAINIALQEGANIINISGGEFSPTGTANTFLADAVRKCAANGVLIVAAAGNEGCECLHVPGALPSVLAVGAMNSQGEPLEFSNWGERYQIQGILAPGENILGASLNGGTITNSGTSYAAPIVTGIVALMLSLQLKRGQEPNTHDIKAAILDNAIGCDEHPTQDCRRLLAGRINVKEAVSQILQGGVSTMSDLVKTQEDVQTRLVENVDNKTSADQVIAADVQAGGSDSVGSGASEGPHKTTEVSTETSKENEKPVDQSLVDPSRIKACSCSCGGGEPCTCGATGQMQLVFALGTLGFDFGTESRRDSIKQHMNGDPSAVDQLLDYLEKNPWDAATIIWTLNLDETTFYAVQGQGAFASDIYKRLRQFLNEQITEGVERISLPGIITGNTRLMNGHVVPTIFPCLRGMYSWSTDALIQAVCGKPPKKDAKAQENDVYSQKVQAVRNFLERVYFEHRNFGTAPQDRAINYAATNAFNAGKVFESALKDESDLDGPIEVERSPICRPESECWDVKLTFFNPKKVFEQARKVYRFTVDVSNIEPVMVGPIRSWFVR